MDAKEKQKITVEQLKTQLKRFEALSDTYYSGLACEIWWEKFKDWESEKFIRYAKRVENDVMWHIQPTPKNIIEKRQEAIRYY